MPGSHWMIVTTPESFEVTRQRGYDLLGLRSRHRKKAERMSPGDRILYYVAGIRVFPATAIVTSGFFEDSRPIWQANERRPEVFPWRVHTRADVVLREFEYLDAYQLAPRLLYVKRWAPEDWPLAFQGQVHLLSAADYGLVEGEMRRVIQQRPTRRQQPPRRPRDLVWTSAAPAPISPGLSSRNGPAPAPGGSHGNGKGNIASTSSRGTV